MNVIGVFRTSLAHSCVFGRCSKHYDLGLQRSAEEEEEEGGGEETDLYKSPPLFGGGDLKNSFQT